MGPEKFVIPGWWTFICMWKLDDVSGGIFAGRGAVWSHNCGGGSHEIANVFGLEGILSFMEQETELDIFMVFRPVFRLPEQRWNIRGRSLEKELQGASAG